MSRNSLLCLTVYLAFLSEVVAGRVKSPEPIKTTICELVKTPERFDGAMVQVVATIGAGFEASLLVDDGCSARIWLSVREKPALGTLEYADIHSINDIKAPERLDWKPLTPRQAVILKKDRAFRRLARYLSKQFKPKDPREICISYPLYSVSASMVGRFDHTDRKWRMVRGDDADKVPSSMGFGHLNSWDSQLVLQSVSNVVAKPIDRSVYEKKK